MFNNFSKTALVVGLLALGVTSCKKDETRVMAEFGAAPVLKANTSAAGTLLLANSAASAVTFTWTPYVMTLSDGAKATSPMVYTLQYAKAGTNFAEPKDLVISDNTSTSLTLTVEQLNNAFIALKQPFGQTAALDFRLKTFTAGNEAVLYSATTTVSAAPYDACVPPNADKWSLIGPAGTDWSTDIPLTWSCTENAYMLTSDLKADEFKFRLNNDWTTNLGSAGAGVTAVGVSTPLTLKGGGPNLKIATAGRYTIKFVPGGAGAGATTGTVTITQ